MKQPIEFYSEGFKLEGDVYRPVDLAPGERRAGVVLCHGYTGVKDAYLPDNARVLNRAGYVVLTFNYKGWGNSEGARHRLAPYGRVADVQAAMTCLGLQDGVDPERLGLYGTSYGGATVSWVGAIDARARCIVSVVGIGDGTRWMRSVRRPDEWHDLLERSRADRERRVATGRSELAARNEVLLADRNSLAFAKRFPPAVTEVPLDYVDDTVGFNPEWIVDRIAPRPILFITTDDDRLVQPAESEALYRHAGEPKRLVVLKGYGHYDVYEEPAFGAVMAATLDWFGRHLPARAAR